ncbi:hypothetical protein [Chryseobacterium sp. JUb7]|uniref:pirin family protein n=1 Tax=Chryseobacterium sp. JUb7 TaxID=2940599 RepID=UPI002169B480|nr:hypothetical protein [Chryseobacterium sp. JUb7]MCS3532631.1 hypothetical protein [Chryseobacterium sp. JUb7]
MIVNSDSTIFNSNTRSWCEENSFLINEMNFEDKNLKLKKVTEVIIKDGETFSLNYPEDSQIIILVLYGKITTDCFPYDIFSNQVFVSNSNSNNTVEIRNGLEDESTDIIIFEVTDKDNENFISLEDLVIKNKNELIPLTNTLTIPCFIGLYDGRKKQRYTLKQKNKSIFGIVINGACEFQDRLMETRDAILLYDINALEFEALSENLLIIFLEV